MGNVTTLSVITSLNILGHSDVLDSQGLDRLVSIHMGLHYYMFHAGKSSHHCVK